MEIDFASIDIDFEYLQENDVHIPVHRLHTKIERKEIIVIRNNGISIGWLRFGFFWDMIPIMNMLSLEENFRSKGFGTQLVSFWENKMQKQGHNIVLTTTLSDEDAQHFYRKLGYKDTGALLLPDEALEIILIKHLA